MSQENRILFCRCSPGGVGGESVRRDGLAGLRERGLPFVEVDDLCRLAADRDAGLAALMAEAGSLTVVACHPRAVRGLFSAAGVTSAEPQLQVLDLRTTPAATILDQLPGTAAPLPAVTQATDPWTPWFPVIDPTRCTQCRQCMSFCLFGVYTLTPEGKVVVTNPRSCKNNCPACARICPHVAIIFPKLPDAEAPLNGAEIGDEQNMKARARINAHELLGDDLYAALAQRRQTRRRLLKSEQERAEEERAACSREAPPATQVANGPLEG